MNDRNSLFDIIDISQEEVKESQSTHKKKMTGYTCPSLLGCHDIYLEQLSVLEIQQPISNLYELVKEKPMSTWQEDGRVKSEIMFAGEMEISSYSSSRASFVGEIYDADLPDFVKKQKQSVGYPESTNTGTVKGGYW